MKRFHVHAHVQDLPQSVAFYTRLFGVEPTRLESDYAKWMLDDPRINFAISARGAKPGIDHLGFQTDSAEELAELKARATNADMALLDEGQTSCCYARSDKHWITDPQGVAWEHFHTLDNIPVFSEAPRGNAESACCANPGATPGANTDAVATGGCSGGTASPTTRGKPIGVPVKGSSCC